MPSAQAPDTAVLAAILHDAERIIDHQVQAIEELDDKAEHMIGLAVALLAGGLSLATVAVTDGLPFDRRFLWMLSSAAAVNLAAVLVFLESYIGFRMGVEVNVGPAMDWLQDKASDPGWSLASHYRSLLHDDSFPAYYRFNLRKMLHSAATRKAGLFALAGSVLLYAVALVYLLAISI